MIDCFGGPFFIRNDKITIINMNNVNLYPGVVLVKDKSQIRKVYKLNEDDILEILSEHLAKKSKFDTFRSRSLLIGEAEKDSRLISVIRDIEDVEIRVLDLEEIDKRTEFNGDH